MFLEYLAEGAAECPLIRLYAFTTAEAQRFEAAVTGLANGRVNRVDVHALPGVEPVGGCQLTLFLHPWDQAVIRTGPASFTCGFTAGVWHDVAGRVTPLAHGADGYQWLVGTPGEAGLLLSARGDW